MVGTTEWIEHYTERHEKGLFTREEYQDAFHQTDWDVKHDPNGLFDGRDNEVYIRKK